MNAADALAAVPLGETPPRECSVRAVAEEWMRPAPCHAAATVAVRVPSGVASLCADHEAALRVIDEDRRTWAAWWVEQRLPGAVALVEWLPVERVG